MRKNGGKNRNKKTGETKLIGIGKYYKAGRMNLLNYNFYLMLEMKVI